MRVIHIISGNDSGGAKTHLFNLCSSTINYFNNTIGCINEGALYDEALKRGLDTVVFKQSSRMDLSIVKGITSFIGSRKFDIVNFHGANPNFLHGFLKGKVSVPMVTTIHSDFRYDFVNNKLKQLIFTPVNSMALRGFKYYICVSRRISDVLEDRKYSGEKFVVGNGIDTSLGVIKAREEIRKEYGIPEDCFLYIMVARFHPIKNHQTLIKAFKKLNGKYDNTRLMLVGSGDNKGSMESLAGSLGLGDCVIFTGHRDNPLDHINAADVNMLTSLDETFPIVILEGALASKAAICSDVGDVRDILNENTGFIINPMDMEDIYEKMEQAYLGRDDIGLMGSRLNEVVLQDYTIDRFCRKYWDAYNKILSGDDNG